MDFLKRIVPNSLFLVLPLNLRLSLIQFLLTLFLSLNGQVKFPFKGSFGDYLDPSTHAHQFNSRSLFPLDWEIKKKRCCNRFSVQLYLSFLMARTTWHMTYSGFPWASMTEQGRNFACCGFAAGAWCFGIRHTFCTAGNHGDVVWAAEIWVVVGDVDQIKLRIRVIGEVGELGLFIFAWSGIGQTTRLPPASGCVWDWH